MNEAIKPVKETDHHYDDTNDFNEAVSFFPEGKYEARCRYFGARYYDPNISIWLSVDPLSDKYPNWSAYNYSLNSPVCVVDFDGNGPFVRPTSRTKEFFKKAGLSFNKSLYGNAGIKPRVGLGAKAKIGPLKAGLGVYLSEVDVKYQADENKLSVKGNLLGGEVAAGIGGISFEGSGNAASGEASYDFDSGQYREEGDAEYLTYDTEIGDGTISLDNSSDLEVGVNLFGIRLSGGIHIKNVATGVGNVLKGLGSYVMDMIRGNGDESRIPEGVVTFPPMDPGVVIPD